MSGNSEKSGGRANSQEVIRGLEGVVAAETDISYVDGVNGDLYYKGYIWKPVEYLTIKNALFNCAT